MIKMKKTYIQPNLTMVVLTHTHIIAASDTGLRISGSDATDGDVLVKENYPPISDNNVWDDEW